MAVTLSAVATRSPLLWLHGDDKLIAMTRRGDDEALATLVDRHRLRLVAFCRHSLCFWEDPDQVLREVRAGARHALREHAAPIGAKPLLYRAARRRCLERLERARPPMGEVSGVVRDVSRLPEDQRTALLLREQGALSYPEIGAAMETTVPAVKSLLVHARVGLAEVAEARAAQAA